MKLYKILNPVVVIGVLSLGYLSPVYAKDSVCRSSQTEIASCRLKDSKQVIALCESSPKKIQVRMQTFGQFDWVYPQNIKNGHRKKFVVKGTGQNWHVYFNRANHGYDFFQTSKGAGGMKVYKMPHRELLADFSCSGMKADRNLLSRF